MLLFGSSSDERLINVRSINFNPLDAEVYKFMFVSKRLEKSFIICWRYYYILPVVLVLHVLLDKQLILSRWFIMLFKDFSKHFVILLQYDTIEYLLFSSCSIQIMQTHDQRHSNYDHLVWSCFFPYIVLNLFIQCNHRFLRREGVT